jgi:flagellar protein FliO/FliZ
VRGAGAATLAALPAIAAACAGAGEAAPVLVLAAAGAAASWALRRRRDLPAEPPVRVEARAPLGREAGVALVRAGGERILVGYGRDGVRRLARLPAPTRPEGEP